MFRMLHINYLHKKLKPHQCQRCIKSFLVKRKLILHINTVHEKLRPHQCPQCQKWYALKEGLKVHISKYHSKSPNAVLPEKQPNIYQKLPKN